MNDDLKNQLNEYKAKGVKRVKVAITDLDGVLRGKYISMKKFQSVAESTGAFCDCIFGWDINDQLYENDIQFTGWHTAYPDAHFKIDLSSQRWLKDENIPLYLGEFVDKDLKSKHPICPKSVLSSTLAKAKDLGLGFNLAFEYEFFVFNETMQSVRDKNYKNLIPLTPGMCGYSILRNSTYSDLFNDFMDYCNELNIPLEGLHCETGPGVWEAAIEYDEAMLAADKATLFKTFAKVFFQKRDLITTFMARWNLAYPGQSGHVHLSAFDIKNQENLFYDPSKPHNMSERMVSFVAGMSKYMKPFLPMTTPTINSYTRLVKGFWAPTAATWGVENRTCALRVIPGDAQSQRVEYRVGSADANPYLTAAALIGAGLKGIENNLKLEPALTGNAYDVQDSLPLEKQLPTSLKEAIQGLKISTEADELFGKQFTEHYVKTREWEVSEYEKAITDWQLERYFELT